MAEDTVRDDEDKGLDAPEKGQADDTPTSNDAAFEVAPAGAEPKGAEDEVVTSDGGEQTIEDPVLAELDAQGIEHTFGSGAEAIRSYKEQRRLLGKTDSERQLGKEVMPHLEAWRSFQDARAKEEAEKDNPKWDVPVLPPNHSIQSQLAEDQRDPVYTRAVQNRNAYLTEKWEQYMQNPRALFEEHHRAATQEMIDQAVQRMNYEAQLRQRFDPDKAFIEKHYDEIAELKGRMPVEDAIELAKLRHTGGKSQKAKAAVAARENDEAEFAAQATGLTSVGEPEEEETDFHAIAQQELRKAKVAVN